MRAEDLPRSFTRPQMELASLISDEIGLVVELEFPVGAYRVDILVKEVWAAVEYDGLGHRRSRDDVRDARIQELSGLVTIRVTPERFQSDGFVTWLRERLDEAGATAEERCNPAILR